jgi:hypothetical protein
MKKLTVYQILTLLLVVQLLLVKLVSHFPNFIEHYYSNGIYPFISKLFRSVFGWIPFSIGDVFYFLLGLTLLISIYKFIKNKGKGAKQHLFRFGAYLSVFYFLFHLLWGMNYHRNSLFKTLELEQKEYTLEELTNLTHNLLNKLKQTHLQLVSNDTLKVEIPYSKSEIIKKTASGYKALSKEYPQYTYKRVSLKKSIFSVPLTYMGFSGYFNPLSGEAQVDYLVPKVSLPMISSHEVAHQLGIASESEANFIGFLAATKSEDKNFNYSAYIIALRYSVSAIHFRDSITSKEIIKEIPIGILKNIKESQEFWQSYQNAAEPFFKLFYDNYLKANQQKDGMQSYSKMVNLLVVYNEKYDL